MDNHVSHISYVALEHAKKNGVYIVTLPPHTSQKLQPLDRAVYGPLKTYFNSAANGWMLKNPGRNITIHHMADLIGMAWMKAATPTNITAGFKACGIWPLDRSIFSDEAFLPSAVTDNPFPEEAGPDPSVERGDDTELVGSEPGPSSQRGGDTELVGSEPGPSSQRGGDTELVGSEPGPSSQRGGDTELVGSEPGPSSQRGGDTELVGSEPGPSSQRGGDTELVGSEPGPSSQRGGDTKLVGSEPGSLSWKIASPEQIRGYPKAAARQGKRKSGTSIVARHANSTPEMKRLKCVMESKNAKKPKGKCSAKAARKLVVESKERPGSDSDVTCLVCGMRFDRSAEEWIQCVSCKAWACVPCTDVDPGQVTYVCDLCRDL
ncbi:hypothetical protein FJT64_021058 [Amphibalanus amphitrite]|uniref:DDE-1 domain-containing protein n=1 Tax=Amphibalanus amphitrite TaxID=1232801 RepID=A0A6A4WNN1_AMPAM|nr:hypothetical protein FJT64_021058 [Amphibalanus amphitrite]